ncbi:3,4-dihydroxy-2-butanone-4-phosphate synthase [Nakamurella leprariae]|uniref:3,4-dihydroxy-2-butanone 4-phosphate synthase n=1 Tax=Nakamurella leprariae TaxID=2803911 RepID=A0A939BZ83_9ACTN|nr:3,4-dihydroxy-2-butanone-4-phosphate synthase [Nakamurella leprariae]MBM9467426.1 3,4-dihydroxy-2-butanone-4-phosphate synthase [Nakamurella leprariae]
MTASVRFDTLDRAVAELRLGRPVVVVDDEDRENEGDLIWVAELATPQTVGFAVRYSSGILCVAMDETRADELDLPPMAAKNTDPKGTAYAVTVDARHGVSTGISAADRALTIKLLGEAGTRADELTRPGHVLPLRAKPGGVLQRTGHTEAAVDLARMAGCTPVGALVEVVSEQDPTGMARAPELREFADRHGLAMISIAMLVAHRQAHQAPIVHPTPTDLVPSHGAERVASVRLPMPNATARMVGYRGSDGREYVAVVSGSVAGEREVLLAVHAECLAGQAFGSLRCQCRGDLLADVDTTAEQAPGIVLYLRDEEPGADSRSGVLNTLRRYQLQDQARALAATGRPCPPAEAPAEILVDILRDLGPASVRLLPGSERFAAQLRGAGVPVDTLSSDLRTLLRATALG